MGRLKASYNWLTKTKLGFFTVVVVFFWIKTYLTYITKFNLGVVGPMQKFLLLINPLPTAVLLIGIGLFFKGRKSYWIMVIIDFLLSLCANVAAETSDNFFSFKSSGILN